MQPHACSPTVTGHPGVVALLEVIETREAIHLVLEHAPGGTLQQVRTIQHPPLALTSTPGP